MLIKPSAMDGALYGIPLAWIHYYKIKEPPKMNHYYGRVSLINDGVN